MKPLILRKQSVKYPELFVKKYTKSVFYDNRWHEDPSLVEARGHVEHEKGHLVVAPLTKIFNRHENNTDISRDEYCLAVDKINGFMACATFVPEVNDVVISTTGSLDSDFVTMAGDYITDRVRQYISMRYLRTEVRETFVFEIVHPKDPHIIEEQCGAYLLAVRRVADETPYFSCPEHEANLDAIAYSMKVMRPSWFVGWFDNMVKYADRCDHEGVVVYGQNSKTCLKIKSPYYLCAKAAARKKDIDTLSKLQVDEEYYGLIDHLKDIRDQYNAMDEQQRLAHIRSWLTFNNQTEDAE